MDSNQVLENLNDEVMMWRKKFVGIPQNGNKKLHLINHTFLALTSCEMIKYGPCESYKKIVEDSLQDD